MVTGAAIHSGIPPAKLQIHSAVGTQLQLLTIAVNLFTINKQLPSILSAAIGRDSEAIEPFLTRLQLSMPAG